MHRREEGKIRQENRGCGARWAFRAAQKLRVDLRSNSEPLKVFEQEHEQICDWGRFIWKQQTEVISGCTHTVLWWLR